MKPILDPFCISHHFPQEMFQVSVPAVWPTPAWWVAATGLWQFSSLSRCHSSAWRRIWSHGHVAMICGLCYTYSAYVMIDHDISGTMWWFAGNIRELRSPMSPMFMHHGEMGSETERLSSKPLGLVNGRSGSTWLDRPNSGAQPQWIFSL